MLILLPQIGCVLPADDATGIPSKGMTSHAPHADERHIPMLYRAER